MSRPVRIQLSRRKGFKLQLASQAMNGLEAVNVARPGPWGNPFVVGEHGTAAECVRLYRLCVLSQERPGDLTAHQLRAANIAWPDAFSMPCATTAKAFLGGKNLACWCKPGEPCHADVLLEIAAPPTNAPDMEE